MIKCKVNNATHFDNKRPVSKCIIKEENDDHDNNDDDDEGEEEEKELLKMKRRWGTKGNGSADLRL